MKKIIEKELKKLFRANKVGYKRFPLQKSKHSSSPGSPQDPPLLEAGRHHDLRISALSEEQYES